ncbi:MAG: NAD(P)/FAD-dependent oxidoreductase [Gemmatimonadota bacterium]
MARARIAIVGAGPAGSTAARLLTEWAPAGEYDVTLFSRRAPTIGIAESLPPSCGAILDRVGLIPHLTGAGFLRSTGNTALWGEDLPRVEFFPEGQGFQVWRPRFDALLADLVRSRDSGAEIIESSARSCEPVDDVYRLSWTDGEVEMEGRFDFVLDCSGRSGLTTRIGGNRRRPEAGVRTLALAGVWRRPDGWPVPDASHTLVESFTGGWGWSVPFSETERCFAIMIDPGELRLGGPAASVWRETLARSRLLGPLLEGSEQVGSSGPVAIDASPYSSADPVAGRSLLVGDAASFIDPLSSFGVKKALASAWLAAVSVHSAIVTPEVEAAAFELYAGHELENAEAARAALASASRESGLSDLFWEVRSALQGETGSAEVEALRDDPRVQEVFADLRSRPAVALARGQGCRTVEKGVVTGNRVVLRTHYIVPGFRNPVRFIRNVDIEGLAAIAEQNSDVGLMYERYGSRFGKVPLADFLGTLSTMIAKGILRFA